jgi:hypothetical protein
VKLTILVLMVLMLMDGKNRVSSSVGWAYHCPPNRGRIQVYLWCTGHWLKKNPLFNVYFSPCVLFLK